MTIRTACRNYFHLIRHPLEPGRKRSEKIFTALAIFSCITVIVPAAMGAFYGISSLAGRVSKSVPKNSNSRDATTDTDQVKQSEKLKPESPKASSKSQDEATVYDGDVKAQSEKPKTEGTATVQSRQLEETKPESPKASSKSQDEANEYDGDEKAQSEKPKTEGTATVQPTQLEEPKPESPKASSKSQDEATVYDGDVKAQSEKPKTEGTATVQPSQLEEPKPESPKASSESQDEATVYDGDENEQMERFAKDHNFPIELIKKIERFAMLEYYAKQQIHVDIKTTVFYQTFNYIKEQWPEVQLSFLKAKEIIAIQLGKEKLFLLPGLQVGAYVEFPFTGDELDQMLKGKDYKIAFLVIGVELESTPPERRSDDSRLVKVLWQNRPAIILKMDMGKNKAYNLETVLGHIKTFFNQ